MSLLDLDDKPVVQTQPQPELQPQPTNVNWNMPFVVPPVQIQATNNQNNNQTWNWANAAISSPINPQVNVPINPCDYNQTKAATIAIANYEGPVYLRFGRPSVPNFTPADQHFEIGKAVMLNEGADVSIFATGHLVWKAIEAGEQLAAMGINAEIINIHTIKPLDNSAVIASAKKTRCVVTAEEHQMNGGLGDSIAQLLARELPTPIEMVAVNDSFGESGTPDQLMTKYGLDAVNIVEAVKKVIARKS